MTNPIPMSDARSPGPRRRLLQYASLLYTIVFFFEPVQRNDRGYWIVFALFYVVFLSLFFAVPLLRGRAQLAALGALFVLGYAYYPFNLGAGGVVVFGIALSAYIQPRTRPFLVNLVAQSVAVVVETIILRLPFQAAQVTIFFAAVIGLSYLAYFQEQVTNQRLQRANAEIAELSQEAERARIARDLHDLLGQSLTVITVKLDLARRLLPKTPERALVEIVDAEALARRALTDVRATVTGYRSDGFASELALARRALAAANVDLALSVAPIALAADHENVLALAVREAVTNIVRHARAHTCRVELSTTPACVRLRVADDGRGGTPVEGNGLRGMRERVALLGGAMMLDAPRGDGLHLVIELPREHGS